MEVVRFSRLKELQVHAAAWDCLAAGVPFRTWTWLSTWWRHYAALGQLYVLGVFDHGQLVGLAPWYRANPSLQGRTLRFLGDAEVCSEYGTILRRPGREHAVAGALAGWLLQTAGGDQWDLIELATVDLDDPMPRVLAQRMKDCGCRLHCRAGRGCWRAAFPPAWEDYLQSLSKHRRKKLRRLERRYVETGRAVLHTVRGLDELADAEKILIDLHQRRREMLGQSGSFASTRYRDFQADVMPRLLLEGQLGLHWVEFDGRPVAAEYHLLGNNVMYCYQGGISPEHAPLSPGQIAMLLTFKQAIDRGCQAFDLLRGNELYKRQWRAKFRPSVELRIVAGRALVRLRHGLWTVGLDVKQWLNEALGAGHLP